MDYTVQDGTIDRVTDVAVATVSVTGVIGSTVSTGKATFTNHQSIYKFTFKNGATTLNVRAVTIRSAGNKLVTKDNLLSGASYGAVSISNETAQSAVYAALKFSSNPSETISFTLVDDNGILYTGSKSSPAGGLVDNQFYTSEVSVTPSATMPYPFTIDNYTSKSVYLAAGNLYFKDNQYTFYPCKAPFHEPAGDLTAEQRRDRCWFQWGVVNTSFASASSTQNVYFNGTASQGWYTLTQEQWHCLYGQRQMSSSNIWPWYRITTTAGILLPPDNATEADLEGLLKGESNSLSETAVLRYISKGFAFLRSSGYYYGTTSQYITSEGYYWTLSSYDDEKAYYCTYSSSVAPKIEKAPKANYRSVRLVHD